MRFKKVYRKQRHFVERGQIGRRGKEWRNVHLVRRAMKAIQYPWYNKQKLGRDRWKVTLAFH